MTPAVAAALLLLSLSCSADVEAARAGLARALEAEQRARDVDVVVDGDRLVVRVLRPTVFERLDPLWKILAAAARASKSAPVVVALAAPDVATCATRTTVVDGYLFGKRRADRARVEVRASCGADFADPQRWEGGGLVVEADRQLVREYSTVDGASFRARNTGASAVELVVEGLELRSRGADAPPPTPYPIDGMWFHDVTAVAGDAGPAPATPYVQVRAHGVGPLVVSVAPGATVEIMAQLARGPRSSNTAARRLRFSVGGAHAAVAGPIATIGFSSDSVFGD